ncbi:MAG: 23S rRNA (uracil(1939)-C(5))-methyltransferase RlmD [Clostridia bacterium]|nr:23S rRNA (uracil(1939)-C(5))-methyltransferase RlmD [Clostridia bacterium]
MNNIKNTTQNLIINNLGINGEGIAKLDGITIFLPFALPNEEVEVKIIKEDKHFLKGELKSIITQSKFRVTAPCPVFEKCGGCQLQHLKYDEQLNFKTNLVKETFKKVGNIEFTPNNCTPSDNEYNYRNKISLPIRSVEGELKIGFFANNSHRIVEIESCPLQQNLTNKIIKVFKDFMIKHNIPAYDEENRKGLVKHLVAREFKDALLVAVVINGKEMKEANKLYEVLKQNFNKVTLYLNHNDKSNNVILGARSTLVGGDKFLVEELQGLSVKTGVVSFMQVNDGVRDSIYGDALKSIKSFNPQIVIDAYSGAGLLTAIIAKNVSAKVYGLEIISEAVDASNKMLKENNLEAKVQNILGDCSLTLPKLMSDIKNKTTLVLDPPRKGLDKAIINAILVSRPEQIIYIACGLTSLARDAAYLTNTKDILTDKTVEIVEPIYEIVSVTPYDMFPQTKHVETLVELRLKK